MADKSPKELMKIVVTRAVLGKLTDDSKLAQLNVGDEVSMQRKYAEELISIRKAVVNGSPEHEAWVDRQKAKAAQAKAKQKQSTATKPTE